MLVILLLLLVPALLGVWAGVMLGKLVSIGPRLHDSLCRFCGQCGQCGQPDRNVS
jgi:hypothetical protein